MVTVAFAVFGWPVAGASAAGDPYVAYYVVTSSYHGSPENLSEIADRFLGSASRAADIFDLNSGRTQPDGGKLTNPSQLDTGWLLVLPWDAVGTGVRYGQLPSSSPGPSTAPPPVPSGPSGSSTKHSGTGSPSAGATPCAGSPSATAVTQGQWAALRVAADQAWAYTKGAGELIAVVDSGVDSTVPSLAGRVTVGADVVGGTGRGSSDCLGSGTAMAAIVAASSSAQGTTPTGVAPAATILPVRVASTQAPVSLANQVAAVQIAIADHPAVIAIGSAVDVNQPPVAQALAAAAATNIVVVVAAPSAGVVSAPAAPSNQLRVGEIAVDGKLGMQYAPRTVDVVAPGVTVTTAGISGTDAFVGSGTQYAVAFVAGEAALVRARFPELTAAEVVKQIDASATPLSSGTPDPNFGWGLINPAAAVTTPPPNRAGPTPGLPPRGDAGSSKARTVAFTIALLVVLAMIILLVLRLRQLLRRPVEVERAPEASPAATPSAAPAALAATDVRAGTDAGPLPAWPNIADVETILTRDASRAEVDAVSASTPQAVSTAPDGTARWVDAGFGRDE